MANMYQLRRSCRGLVRHARRRTGGCGAVEDRQPLDQFRVSHGQPPRDDAAPVVPDHARLLHAERSDDGCGVVGEPVDGIVRNPRWLVAGVVAALVEGDDVVSGVGERADLVPPAVPELGEAVEQQDGRSGPGRRR